MSKEEYAKILHAAEIKLTPGIPDRMNEAIEYMVGEGLDRDTAKSFVVSMVENYIETL